MRHLNKRLLLVTGIAVVSGCIAYHDRSFNHHAQKTVEAASPVSPGTLIDANLTHTDFGVTGGDTDKCTLTADLYVNATSQEIADAVAEQTDVELVCEDGRLAIVIRKPKLYEQDYSISAKMRMTVPADVKMDINTTHGDCRFDNVEQALTVRTTHGDLQFNRISGNVDAVSTHGDIELTEVRNGLIQITTTHGVIVLNKCTTEKIQCTTTHDPIRLNACSVPQAVLKTSHGAITGEMRNIERLDAQTSHAPIRLDCYNQSNPDITAVLKTTHDPIEFSPPAGFAGTVSASTSHGRIRTDLPIVVQGEIGQNQLRGTIGEGDGMIKLETSHANIRLQTP